MTSLGRPAPLGLEAGLQQPVNLLGDPHPVRHATSLVTKGGTISTQGLTGTQGYTTLA